MLDARNKHHRTLAFDPSTNGFGFAVLESRDQLIDWGVARIWSKSTREFLARVEGFIDRYQPDLIVLEDVNDTRRGTQARNRIIAIARFSLARRIPVRMVSRTQVRHAFRDYGLTKFEIALAIARMFPELAARMPRYRKPWMSEDARMNIFDAVSFIITDREEPEGYDRARRVA
jgi:hypothetical protein